MMKIAQNRHSPLTGQTCTTAREVLIKRVSDPFLKCTDCMWLLRNGRQMISGAVPTCLQEDFRRHTLEEVVSPYFNAIHVASRAPETFAYCEGIVAVSNGVFTKHGWLVSRDDGCVVDPFLSVFTHASTAPMREYFGVIFEALPERPDPSAHHAGLTDLILGADHRCGNNLS